MQSPIGSPRSTKRAVHLTPEATMALAALKQALASTVMLQYQQPDAPISIEDACRGEYVHLRFIQTAQSTVVSLRSDGVDSIAIQLNLNGFSLVEDSRFTMDSPILRRVTRSVITALSNRKCIS
ncbi:hypothetical protein P879_07556 [Paragonimus westermani]|uniref:Uncharacterized protein n=1 Tax=Paragonimus westermani TaxID=34504 RepID=A0A8T0D7P8_9TREM|nr:hypothetical protein P879_07556 [Paragonimus westermani]